MEPELDDIYAEQVVALQAQLEAVRRERDEAASDRDEWITSWRALQRHNERIEAALDAERETVIAVKADALDVSSKLRKELATLQAQLRQVPEAAQALFKHCRGALAAQDAGEGGK